MRKHCLQRIGLAVALGFVVRQILAAAPALQVLSQAEPAFPPADSGSSDSFAPWVSPDGRYVLFVSQAGNLVTNDHNGFVLHVFLRDLTSGATTLVSVNREGGSGGNDHSVMPMLSTNGQLSNSAGPR